MILFLLLFLLLCRVVAAVAVLVHVILYLHLSLFFVHHFGLMRYSTSYSTEEFKWMQLNDALRIARMLMNTHCIV